MNLINNLRKVIVVAERIVISKGMIPFEIPGSPSKISLKSYNENKSSITIIDKLINTLVDLGVKIGKGSKQNFIIPVMIDELMQYMRIFTFILDIIFGAESLLHIQHEK